MIPEAIRLRALLARRDYLAGQLAEVDRRVDRAAAAYSTAKGYRVRPRIEAIRQEVNP